MYHIAPKVGIPASCGVEKDLSKQRLYGVFFLSIVVNLLKKKE